MTNQEKKEFLWRYRAADGRLTALFDELASWRSRAEKITPLLSGLPGGGAEDSLQTAVERITDLEQRIDREIVRLMLLRTEIREVIETVQDERLRAVLEYRYIHGDTWEKIAERMRYDRRWIHRLHGKALQKLTIESHYFL